MKYLITMHMPSSNGFLVHQVIFDHHSENIGQLCEILNNDIFVIGKQFYKRMNDDGDSVFIDKGHIVLNTAHIGKAQEYIDYGSDDEGRNPVKQRPPIRSRNQNIY